MAKKITIAIQRKGRLFDSSKELLIKSGINFSTSGEKLLARSSNMNIDILLVRDDDIPCLLYTSPSPRDLSTSRMPSSA